MMKSTLTLFAWLFSASALAATWPTESGEWQLQGRSCTDGTKVLTGPGHLAFEVQDQTKFTLSYEYVHDRGLGDQYASAYCRFRFSYQMSHDATHPDRINHEAGGMISSGVMCLGNTSPDFKIKNEWRAPSYQVISSGRDVLVIATSNNEECSGDGLVRNEFTRVSEP